VGSSTTDLKKKKGRESKKGRVVVGGTQDEKNVDGASRDHLVLNERRRHRPSRDGQQRPQSGEGSLELGGIM